MAPTNNRATVIAENQARAVLVATISTIEAEGLHNHIGLPAAQVLNVLTHLRTNLRIAGVGGAGFARQVARLATYELGYEAGLLSYGGDLNAPPEWQRGYADGGAVSQRKLEPPASLARVTRAEILEVTANRCPVHPGETLERVAPHLWECPTCGRSYVRKDLH